MRQRSGMSERVIDWFVVGLVDVITVMIGWLVLGTFNDVNWFVRVCRFVYILRSVGAMKVRRKRLFMMVCGSTVMVSTLAWRLRYGYYNNIRSIFRLKFKRPVSSIINLVITNKVFNLYNLQTNAFIASFNAINIHIISYLIGSGEGGSVSH